MVIIGANYRCKTKALFLITLVSPAKINVFLKVIGKRADGYHDIISLFQTISLADTLTIEESHKDEITCSHPEIPVNHENIVMKAMELFRKKTSSRQFFKIHIEKRIPAGAGLGGGSSNAATALFGFNQFLKNPLAEDELKSITKDIGSDVSFFLSEGSAICSRRGEVVEPIPPLLSGKLFVAMPPFALSTKEVYQTLNLGSLKERILPKRASDYSKETIEYFNDLEEPAFTLSPKLKEIKDHLSQNALAFMTGSGSAIVILGEKDPPTIHECTLYNAHFVTRKVKKWYTLD